MITSARPIDPALSAFPRSPRTASTPGGTGRNSCRRPAEVIDVDHTAFYSFRRTHQSYGIAGRAPARAHHDPLAQAVLSSAFLPKMVALEVDVRCESNLDGNRWLRLDPRFDSGVDPRTTNRYQERE